MIEVNEMLSLRQVKDFAFFQGWGLPISFAYPSSVKPAWQHLLDKSKALKTAMFYRGLFYLSYSKPAGEYQLLREEEGMSLALFHYPTIIMNSIKIRNQKLEQSSKKKPLSHTQALLISSRQKTSSLKIKNR